VLYPLSYGRQLRVEPSVYRGLVRPFLHMMDRNPGFEPATSRLVSQIVEV
jgi:hypothetical protein